MDVLVVHFFKNCYLRKYTVVGCKVHGDVWVHVYAFWVHVYGSVGCMYAVVRCMYMETFGCKEYAFWVHL